MTQHKLALAASIVALTLAFGGASLAQSGSKPSGAPSAESSAKRPGIAQAPKLIAVTLYADWCPGCKELKPKLDAVMGAADEQPCLFVKLDQTDKESRQAEFLLAALGLGDLWKEHAGKTGYTLLVEPKSKQVVATFQANQSVEAMKSALAAAIKR